MPPARSATFTTSTPPGVRTASSSATRWRGSTPRTTASSFIARRPAEDGRIGPKDLDELCPDWRERETFLSGPGEMIDAFADHFESDPDADPEKLHLERFQPKGGGSEEGKGGTVIFLKSDCETECDGSQPILEAGEEAGLELEHGCRMGICHTCVGKLKSGEVRDMRTGEIDGQERRDGAHLHQHGRRRRRNRTMKGIA